MTLLRRLLIAVCMLVSLAPLSASAAELGRLFLSPAERAALERARHARPETEASVDTEEPVPIADIILEPVVSTEVSKPLQVNGYVSRSSGPATVWVNGMDSHQHNLGELGLDPDKVRLEKNAVRIQASENSADVRLKPGQTFDPASAEIHEAYEQKAPAEAP